MATVVGTITKQPDEVLNIAFDFSSALDDGVTIAINRVTSSDAALVISNEAVSGQSITMTVAGGTDGRYKITCLIDTSEGETLEADATVKVKSL